MAGAAASTSADPSAIVTLTARRAVGKRLDLVDGRPKSRTPAPAAHYRPTVRHVGDIDDLHHLLRQLDADPCSVVVRGALLDEAAARPGAAPIRRRIHGEGAAMRAAPGGRRWLTLDIDGVPCPAELNPAADPVGALRWLRDVHLPECFRGVRAVVRWSASAGLDGWASLRAHVWVMLAAPATDAELTELHQLTDWRQRKIDVALFRAVQPIFTSAPVLGDGVVDPLAGNRLVLLDGDRDVADLAPLLAMVAEARAAEERRRADRPKAVGEWGGAPDEVEIASALGALDPDLPRADWLRVLFAIHAGLGADRGEAIARDWSSRGAKFDGADFERVWRSVRGSGITVASLFGMARDRGWKRPERIAEPIRSTPQEQHEPPRLSITVDVATLHVEFFIDARGALRQRSVLRELAAVEAALPRRVVIEAALPFDPNDGQEATDGARQAVADRLAEIEAKITAHGIEVGHKLAFGAVASLRELLGSWVWGPKIEERRAEAMVLPCAAVPYPANLPGDVREIQSPLRAAIQRALADETRSHAIIAYPGSGKTTTTLTAFIEGMQCGGVAALALPRRADVLEKIQIAQGIAEEQGAAVEVVALLGMDHDPAAERFRCAEPHRIRSRAELHERVCGGCPASTACKLSAGNYLADLADVERRIIAARQGGLGVLIVATAEAIHAHRRMFPDDARLAIDDHAAAHQGTVRTIGFVRDVVFEWLHHAEEHLDGLHRTGHSEQQATADYRAAVANRPDRAPAWDDLAAALESSDRDRIVRAAVILEDAIGFDADATFDGAGNRIGGTRSGEVLRCIDDAMGRGRTNAEIIRELRRRERRLDVVPDAMLLPTLIRIAEGIAWGRLGARRKLTEALRNVSPELRAALRADDIRQERRTVFRAGKKESEVLDWPWERPTHDEVRPALTNSLLDILRELVVHGTFPRFGARDKATGEQPVLLPNRTIIDRARDGKVLFLGVARLPEVLKTSLGIEETFIPARPRNLSVLAVHVGGSVDPVTGANRALSWGGKRERRDGITLDTVADRTFRATVAEAAERLRAGVLTVDGSPIRSPVGVVGHLADADELRQLVDEGLIRFVHFGGGHAATDALAGCELLLVRRFARPPKAVAHDADLVRMVTCRDEKPAGGHVVELRRWGVGQPTVAVRIPADPIEQDVLRFDGGYFALNAIERGRSLLASANGQRRVVVLFDGRPGDLAGAVVQAVTPAELRQRLGVDATPIRRDRPLALAEKMERQAQQADELRQRAADWIWKQAESGKCFGSSDLAEAIGTTTRTARRILEGVPSTDSRNSYYLYASRLSEVGTPPVRALAREAGVGVATIDRLLGDIRRAVTATGAEWLPYTALLPRRGHGVAPRVRALDALAAWIADRAAPAAPALAAGGEVAASGRTGGPSWAAPAAATETTPEAPITAQARPQRRALAALRIEPGPHAVITAIRAVPRGDPTGIDPGVTPGGSGGIETVRTLAMPSGDLARTRPGGIRSMGGGQ